MVATLSPGPELSSLWQRRVALSPALHQLHDLLGVWVDAGEGVVDPVDPADEPAADSALFRRVAHEQVVIDATNDFDPSDLGGRTSSEAVADLVSPARVVKAANTLGAAVLASDPHEAGGRRVIFVSGDDVDAKSEVIALFEDAGFVGIDLGDLVTGGVMQQVRGPLAGINLIQLVV